MDSQGCCFCRRIANTDEIDAGLWICPGCARRSHAAFDTYGSGSAGRLRLIRDDGRSVDIETYMNWIGDLAAALRAKARKIDRWLIEIAAST
jgi:hypothetical protein